MTTVLDDDLRERWEDHEHGAGELATARAELGRREAADDGTAVARSHVGRARQRLSEACRFSGLLEEALELKDATIELWLKQEKHRAVYLVRLQRALVLAELGRDEAEIAMGGLREVLDRDPALAPYYTDFWLEYEARRLWWAGDLHAAEARLIEALEFRREHRAQRIVRWTEIALRKVRSGRESV